MEKKYLLRKNIFDYNNKYNINLKKNNINNFNNLNSLRQKEIKLLEEKKERRKNFGENIMSNIAFNYNNIDKNRLNNYFQNIKQINEDDNIDLEFEYFRLKPFSKELINYIIFNLKNKNIKLTNVYQINYKNGKATGFGDFLRGSLFLIQFCKEYELIFEINLINHPFSKYFEKYDFNKTLKNEKINEKIYENIIKFEETNYNPLILDGNILDNKTNPFIYNDFIYYLGNNPIINNNLYIYNICFPSFYIKYDEKEILKNLIKPNNYIKSLLLDNLNYLNFKEKDYEIIHIRLGDKYLLENNNILDINNIKNLKILLNDLNKLDKTKNYLLISDNNVIKLLFKEKYNFIKFQIKELTHSGTFKEYNEMLFINTLIDFYLISLSNRINAYSVYEHGTGFSKWCAEIYDIPYVCKFIN